MHRLFLIFFFYRSWILGVKVVSKSIETPPFVPHGCDLVEIAFSLSSDLCCVADEPYVDEVLFYRSEYRPQNN